MTVFLMVGLLLLSNISTIQAWGTPTIVLKHHYKSNHRQRGSWGNLPTASIPLILKMTANLAESSSEAGGGEENNSNNSSRRNSLPEPTTFREAELLGLRQMQEGNYEEALKGTLRFVT